jgi:hypothetical protein
LREPGEHTSGPNLASRDNVAHVQSLYTILETRPPVPRFVESKHGHRPVGGFVAPYAANGFTAPHP